MFSGTKRCSHGSNICSGVLEDIPMEVMELTNALVAPFFTFGITKRITKVLGDGGDTKRCSSITIFLFRVVLKRDFVGTIIASNGTRRSCGGITIVL